MHQLSELRQTVFDWIEDTTEGEAIDRAINRAITVIEGDLPIDIMRRRLVVTPDSDGIISAPPRLVDIVDIYEGSDPNSAQFIFKSANRIQNYPRKAGYFYRSEGMNEEDDFKLFVNCARLSTTFTSNNALFVFSEEHIGKEVCIDGYKETWRIISVDTSPPTSAHIFPKFNYEDITNVSATIGPVGTGLYRLYDSNGVAYTQEVTIEYREKHPVLITDTDPLLFNAPNFVSLTAVQFMLRQTKYDVDAFRLKEEYEYYKRIEGGKLMSDDNGKAGPSDSLFSVRSRSARRR